MRTKFVLCSDKMMSLEIVNVYGLLWFWKFKGFVKEGMYRRQTEICVVIDGMANKPLCEFYWLKIE